MMSETLLIVAAGLVGLVFLAAAIMKVAAPMSFYRHVTQLGIVPPKAVRAVVPVAIALESAWGAALIFLIWPRFVLPFTALALIALSALTFWSVKSGRTEDCGCYGGFVTPSIGQSLGLNGLYLILILAAFAMLPASAYTAPWKIIAMLVVAVIAGVTAQYALSSELKTGMAVFTPSPLKIGARWKRKWAGLPVDSANREHLVSYMGPTCPHCKRWVRVLNVVHAAPNLPPVLGVMASSPATIEEFVSENDVRFPISTVSTGLMSRLAPAVPTTVLVNDGRIDDQWAGGMSDNFVDKFKRAFFPGAAAS
jgi:hypothetical protein